MLGKLQRWMQRNREWHEGQNLLWPTSVAVGPDGLTSFQNEVTRQLAAALAVIPLQRAGAREIFLTGQVPGTDAVVFIYPDGAQIHRGSKVVYLAERADFSEPQQLIRDFVAALRDLAQTNSSV